MDESGVRLAPTPRGPVNAQRKTPDDPPDPRLKEDVLQLSSEIPLERIQADNRLKQAGADGILAVAAFLNDPAAEPLKLIEALRFIASADFNELDSAQASTAREAMALCLLHQDATVRVQAARALQVHGPGAQRTVFLTAIGDPERRVRWAVVRRYSDHPAELDEVQRSILLAYLDAGTRTEFSLADLDGDERLSPREFKGTAEAFARLDRDGDGAVSLEEWTSPVPAEVRADVVALLLRIHAKLTPGLKPDGYNPWLPSSDQLDIVSRWKAWNERVSDRTPAERE
jgi:hypothetical protein